MILPFQLTRAKIPVNFLLFTGSLDSLSHKLCFRVRRRADRNGFRERSQLPRTKRPGKTIVKTMFGHEQHDAWPNEPRLFCRVARLLGRWPFLNDGDGFNFDQSARTCKLRHANGGTLDKIAPGNRPVQELTGACGQGFCSWVGMDGEAPYDCVLGFLSRLCQRGNRPAPSV